MWASSKCPRVESSSGVAPHPPPSSSDPIADEYVDPTATAAPPPSTLNDSSIRRMLDIVMTVQVAHDQFLVDVLTKLQALHADLASFRQSPPPPPFDDESWLSFGNSSQKRGVHMDGNKGRFCFVFVFVFFFFKLWSFRLYLGASWCIYLDVFIFMGCIC